LIHWTLVTAPSTTLLMVMAATTAIAHSESLGSPLVWYEVRNPNRPSSNQAEFPKIMSLWRM
jgi:hypothetical protein